MLSLSQLRTPLTRTEALTFLTDTLNSLGFKTTGWQNGRIQKTILMMSALVLSDLTEVVKFLAEAGFNAYAEGDVLNEFSQSRFDNEKVAAVRTRGDMLLTSTASVPYTFKVGEVIASTDGGVLFRNRTGGTLSAGSVASPSTLTLEFEAVLAGLTGNVGPSEVTRLVTPFAGVTITNGASSPWYSVAGADVESNESLRARNRTKWATFAVDAVAETYEHIARANGATKVHVDASNPRGPGTLDVYAAGDASLLGTSTMEAIQLAYSLRAFYTDAAWPAADTSRVATEHPGELTLDVAATLYHDPAEDASTIQERAETALTDFLRTLPIGGATYTSSVANVVLREDLVDVLKDVEGVRTVVMTTPASTVPVGTLALVTRGTWTLTPVAVSS